MVFTADRIALLPAGADALDYGPHWLGEQMVNCGPGDYLVVARNAANLKHSVIPACLNAWPELPRSYHRGDRVYTYRDTNVHFGVQYDRAGLEGLTCRAAWAHGPMPADFFEFLLRRLALYDGPLLLTDVALL